MAGIGFKNIRRSGVFVGLKDIFSLNGIPGLQAYYDAITQASITASAITGSTSLWGDVSGNSGVTGIVHGGGTGSTTTPSKSVTGSQVFSAQVTLNTYHTATGSASFLSQTSGNNGFELDFTSTGALTLYVGNGTALTAYTSTSVMAVDAFVPHTVTATYVSVAGDAGTIDFAVDGVALGTQITSVNTLTNAAVNLTIGGTNTIGVIYRAQVGSVYDCNPVAATRGASSFVSGGDTYTLTSSATGPRIAGARDAFQGTGASQSINLDMASGQNYLRNFGVNGNGLSTPNLAASTITGDLSAVVAVTLESFSTNYYALASQWPGGGENNWNLVIGVVSDKPSFAYSADGTAATTINSSATLASVGLTTGLHFYLGIYHDVDNGAAGNDVKFYWSLDKVTWAQLGLTQTTAGAITRHNSTGAIFIAADGATPGHVAAGKFYRGELWSGNAWSGGLTWTNGINSGGLTSVLDADPNRAQDGATTFVEGSPNAATMTVTQTGGKPALIVGRAGMLGDGVDDAFATAPFALVQPYTRFTGLRQLTWTAGDYLTDGLTAASGGLTQVTSTPRIGVNAGSAGPYTDSAAVDTPAGAVIVTTEVNGAASTIQVGTGATTTADAGAANPNGLTILAKGGQTVPGNAIIFFDVTFQGLLTAAQKLQVQRYLSRRTAIPI